MEGSGGAGGGGVMKNHYIGRNCLKGRGLGQFADLGGGDLAKEGMVFLRVRGLIPQCTLYGGLRWGEGGPRAELCWGLMGQDSLSSNMRL